MLRYLHGRDAAPWDGRTHLRIDQSQPKATKDFEGIIASAEPFLYAAVVMPLTRRLARAEWVSCRTHSPQSRPKSNDTTNSPLISIQTLQEAETLAPKLIQASKPAFNSWQYKHYCQSFLPSCRSSSASSASSLRKDSISAFSASYSSVLRKRKRLVMAAFSAIPFGVRT